MKTRNYKDPCDAYLDGADIRQQADDEWTKQEQPKQNGSTDPYKLICLADVQPELIRWIWEDRFALGKLTLVGGDPDQGKSQILIDTAARLSTQRHWPLGPRPLFIANTMFLCSEDGVADTIRPRAEAAGADMSKLHFFNSTVRKDGKLRPFTLGNDLDLLGDAIDKVGNVGLVVLDAITSYMGKIDNSSTPDVRAVLDPIAEWAEGLKVAMCGITHPPKAAQKNAIRQFTGSFAYVAAARLAFFCMADPDNPERTLFLSVKNNLGPKARGLGYKIGTKQISHSITAPYIQWDDAPVDYTADQALAANAAQRGGKVEAAKEFLIELLANGPVDAAQGEKAAKEVNISEITLKRAKKLLSVKSQKDTSFKGGWKWTL